MSSPFHRTTHTLPTTNPHPSQLIPRHIDLAPRQQAAAAATTSTTTAVSTGTPAGVGGSGGGTDSGSDGADGAAGSIASSAPTAASTKGAAVRVTVDAGLWAVGLGAGVVGVVGGMV